MGRSSASVAVGWLISLGHNHVEAVVPTSVIKVEGKKIYATEAIFGDSVPEESSELQLNLVRPIGFQDGCMPKIHSSIGQNSKWALLVQRSPNCSFGDRAFAAEKIGASALIVQNSIEGIYRNRTYAESKNDYECDNGESWISKPISKDDKFSGFLSSECAQHSKCQSKRCLLTNENNKNQQQICCAWDSYISMSTSSYEDMSSIHIPSVFIRMIDADTMTTLAPSFFMDKETTLSISIYSRYEQWINSSSLILWLIGTFTAAYASWYSCENVRNKTNHKYNLLQHTLNDDKRLHKHDGNEAEDVLTMDLSLWHAVGFISVASMMLIVLFFFDLYLLVILLYTLSAISTTASVVFRGPLNKILGDEKSQRILVSGGKYWDDICLLDLLAYSLSSALAFLWFFERNTWNYAFILQDVFGISLCVLFLQIIKLPNLKVATLLLCMAFFYDIFFVFLSPFFFEESVMVRVASGTCASSLFSEPLPLPNPEQGNEPTEDPNYCEHYPSDSGCTSNTLPMLLLLPKLNDYEGGYVMLGLGDIVLPGLLLAFGAKFDATSTCMQQQYPRHWILLMIGYSIGLFMANLAVYVMDTGQPALLYLVPCTLGVLILYTKREGTFNEMWEEGVYQGIDDEVHGEDDDKYDYRDNISDHSPNSQPNSQKVSKNLRSSIIPQKRSKSRSGSGYGGISPSIGTIIEETEDLDEEPILMIEV